MKTLGQVLVGGLILAGSPACEFSPTAPFAGFDGKGSRVSGVFDGGSAGAALSAAPQSAYDGLSVSVVQDPSVSASVKSNGSFLLAGVPEGTITLRFRKGDARAGDVVLFDVLPNQEIRIIVALTDREEVVLVDERRDAVDLGGCPRGPGFWCRNQNGQNPNLTAARFQEYAAEAADLLSSVPPLDSADEIAAAVCNTGNQLLRHLATLALNLAAGLLSESTPLIGEDHPTVGEAFAKAIQVALDPSASAAERNRIKDVLDRINNNVNVDTPCRREEDDDEGDDPDDLPPPPTSECPSSGNGRITICHVPPGNPSARHTITISPAAWPAHKSHGDSCGPCR